MSIADTVASWPGVETRPHDFGGREFRLGRNEFGHVHGDSLADVPFPRRVRDALVESGVTERHHVLPDTGWVSFFVREPADAETAVELLRLAYLLRLVGLQRRPDADPSPSVVDAAAELDALELPPAVRTAVDEHVRRSKKPA